VLEGRVAKRASVFSRLSRSSEGETGFVGISMACEASFVGRSFVKKTLYDVFECYLIWFEQT
jgi:hypothetical protein